MKKLLVCLLLIGACSKDRIIQPDLLTVITTSSVDSIGFTSARCGGSITSNGGSAVTERGVCWRSRSLPTLSDSKTVDGAGVGSYTSRLTRLAEHTTYYVRAYATNSEGTSWYSQLPVGAACPSSQRHRWILSVSYPRAAVGPSFRLEVLL